MWVPTAGLPKSAGHPFYERLNRVLDDAGFDAFVEAQCASFYADGVGRPSLAPGRYFRLLLLGYFEGLDSERAIAWRAADSLSIRNPGAATRQKCGCCAAFPSCLRPELALPEQQPLTLVGGAPRWGQHPTGPPGLLVAHRSAPFRYPGAATRQTCGCCAAFPSCLRQGLHPR